LKKAGLLLLIIGSLILLGKGSWIHAKALLAQHLIAQSWEQQQGGADRVKPWSWADTWPVARLRVPALGVDQYVLAGASGRVLAFGPGHVNGTARPGSQGNVVISGHRDTHFRWLRDVQDGDHIELDLTDGRKQQYVITQRQIVSEKDSWVLEQKTGSILRLLTCYPFDSMVPGGSQRYLVTAVPASSEAMF
jgi:sortase A